MTRVFLAMGCCALLTILAATAMADSLTFSYSVTSGTVATIANQFGDPSLTGGPVGGGAGSVVVKDSNTSLTLFLPAGSTGLIQSDNNSFYSPGITTLTASYVGVAATQVQVLSAFCGGVCLAGTNSFGTYSASRGGAGGFGGVFDVTFVSPSILAFFGDSGDSVNPDGGAAFTTSDNTWTPGGTTSSAFFGSGTITFQTGQTGVVPEPGTLPLVLLGTVICGLGGVIRRKMI